MKNKIKKKLERVINNPVAKFSKEFNHSRVFRDRTKYTRKGNKSSKEYFLNYQFC